MGIQFKDGEYFILLDDAETLLEVEPTEGMSTVKIVAVGAAGATVAAVVGGGIAEGSTSSGEDPSSKPKELKETDQEDVVDYLNKEFEDADILKDDNKIEEANVVWDSADKDFNIENLDDKLKADWEETLKEENKDLFDALEAVVNEEGISEREITKKEFDELIDLGMDDNAWSFHIDLGFIDFTLELWHIGLCGFVLILVVVLICKACRQSGGNPAGPAQNQGYIRPQTMADRQSYSYNGPHTHRQVLERKCPSTRKDSFRELKVTLETLEMPLHSSGEPGLNESYVSMIPPSGLNDSIWWILPVSCCAQLVWTFVAYKIYKHYTKHPVQNKRWRRYELREIKVRQ